MYKNLKTLVIILFSFNCLGQNSSYKINAEIIGIKDNTKIFLFDYKNMVIKDSCFSIDNKFSFNGKTLTPIPSGISFTINESTFNLDFWLENHNLFINTTTKKIKENTNSNKISGGFINEIANTYNSILKPHLNKKHKAYKKYKDKKINEKEFQKYKDSVTHYSYSLLLKYPNNIFSLSKILNQTNSLSKKQLTNYYKKLNPSITQTKEGILLKNYLTSKKAKEGETLIDIKGYDLKNNEIKLSNLKGNLIILDFWASWCPPCIEKIKTKFPIISQKYPDVKLVSFSFDFNKNMWKKASDRLRINWTNFSNLTRIKESLTAINYNINEIPISFIIGRDGVLLKRVSFNDDLEKELEKILNKENE